MLFWQSAMSNEATPDIGNGIHVRMALVTDQGFINDVLTRWYYTLVVFLDMYIHMWWGLCIECVRKVVVGTCEDFVFLLGWYLLILRFKDEHKLDWIAGHFLTTFLFSHHLGREDIDVEWHFILYASCSDRCHDQLAIISLEWRPIYVGEAHGCFRCIKWNCCSFMLNLLGTERHHKIINLTNTGHNYKGMQCMYFLLMIISITDQKLLSQLRSNYFLSDVRIVFKQC